LPLLPASYVKLSLCLVLQWTAMAKAVSPPNGNVLADEDLGQWLHTVVALNAAVLQAWPPPAAAAAAAAGHAGSSAQADVVIYTLAAQQAVTFTSETLVPIVKDFEFDFLSKTQAAVVDLLLSVDVLLLLLVHVALLNRQVAAQQQQQGSAEVEQQQQQQEAPQEQLLQAVGLRGLLVQAADVTRTQQPAGLGIACSAQDIFNAVIALRQVFLLRVSSSRGLKGS
jgi:hypothetical protein